MNINLTLFGQMVTFAFFVWFCMKFVWPIILQAMEERQQKIADGLDAADRAVRDLDAAQSKVSDQLKEAKQAAAGIIDQANKRANQIVDEAKEQATAEGERLKVAAQAEIEQEVNRAKEELRATVAGLAIAGAEKVGRHKTSMLQDLEAGRSLEIDALLGSVIELGNITKTPTPCLNTVFALTKYLDENVQASKGSLALPSVSGY